MDLFVGISWVILPLVSLGVRWWLGHNNVEAEGSIIWNTQNHFSTYTSGFLYLAFISTSLRACPYFLSFQQDSLDHLHGGSGIP